MPKKWPNYWQLWSLTPQFLCLQARTSPSAFWKKMSRRSNHSESTTWVYRSRSKTMSHLTWCTLQKPRCLKLASRRLMMQNKPYAPSLSWPSPSMVPMVSYWLSSKLSQRRKSSNSKVTMVRQIIRSLKKPCLVSIAGLPTSMRSFFKSTPVLYKRRSPRWLP